MDLNHLIRSHNECGDSKKGFLERE